MREDQANTELAEAKRLLARAEERTEKLMQLSDDRRSKMQRMERELGACRAFFGHAQMQQALDVLSAGDGS